MIAHYLRIAWRNMQKQKMYAIINIGGFAIGIAACLLIGIYVKQELSYDKDNPNADRVYRIIGEAKMNDAIHRGRSFPAPMSKALVNDFPEIEKAGRIMSSELFGGANNQVRRTDTQNNNYEAGFCFADSSIPDILNIKMVYGDRSSALKEPNSVLLCKSMADKYFPNQNPVGQTLVFNDNTKMLIKVGGVMQDFPVTSHLQYRGFISLAGVNFWNGEQEAWMASNYGIYLQLRPLVNIPSFNKKITADILNKYMAPAMRAAGNKNFESSFADARLYLQKVSDIHLKSYDIDEDDARHGDIRFIWMFTAVAVFILILACINFLNLSTARSANRAREVGVRKVIGSSRSKLIKQFLTESMLYSFISFSIAVIIAIVCLPFLNKLAGTALEFPVNEWWLIPGLLAFAFVIGLAAGLYPSFYLSNFKPVDTLKGRLSLGTKHSGLRSSLVVFQFTVSVILIIGTLVINRQMQFILHSNIGFDKDQVITIQGTNALRNQTAAFRDELMRLPYVKNVSISDYLPVSGTKRNGNTFSVEGKNLNNDGIKGQIWRVDENYIPTLGMQLIAGRNFSKDLRSDSASCIINKAMANQLGYTNPIGHVINNGSRNIIIGVVDNFFFENIRQQVSPLCFVLGNSNTIISVKVNGSDMHQVVAGIENTWKSFLPNQPLRFNFLDESYAAMYADVQRMQFIFSCFSILAIVVACLGLFALAAFMMEQRSKEVSIRKVLGASVQNLFGLLTGSFIKLVTISLVIAIPLAWFIMNKWLQDYAYRTGLTWDMFFLPPVLVLLISLLTILLQSLKTATINPVTTLKSD